MTIHHYLDHTKQASERRALVELTTGSHKLMIDIGRYNQIHQENRLWTIYNSNNIEEKFHFLFQCPKYSTLREIDLL